jgi:hypothetical protein
LETGGPAGCRLICPPSKPRSIRRPIDDRSRRLLKAARGARRTLHSSRKWADELIRPCFPSLCDRCHRTANRDPVKLFHSPEATKQYRRTDEAIFLNSRKYPETDTRYR